eukprot:1139686-Pelagomonas_calceolata.AAC.1
MCACARVTIGMRKELNQILANPKCSCALKFAYRGAGFKVPASHACSSQKQGACTIYLHVQKLDTSCQGVASPGALFMQKKTGLCFRSAALVGGYSDVSSPYLVQKKTQGKADECLLHATVGHMPFTSNSGCQQPHP